MLIGVNKSDNADFHYLVLQINAHRLPLFLPMKPVIHFVEIRKRSSIDFANGLLS
jgi:hypothetical protein